jgi:hypothetical protein
MGSAKWGLPGYLIGLSVVRAACTTVAWSALAWAAPPPTSARVAVLLELAQM